MGRNIAGATLHEIQHLGAFFERMLTGYVLSYNQGNCQAIELLSVSWDCCSLSKCHQFLPPSRRSLRRVDRLIDGSCDETISHHKVIIIEIAFERNRC